MKRPLKLVTYVEPAYALDRIGFLRDGKIIDLTHAYILLLASRGVANPYAVGGSVVPPSMLELLRGGESSIAAVREAAAHADAILEAGKALAGPRGEVMVFDRSGVRLRAPVPRPGKIIHTAGNFREHAREATDAGWEFAIPKWISFMKCTSSIIGDGDAVIYPRLTRKLDHEIELGIIIGKGGRYISEDKSWEHIAGFTVFNDISARDVQRKEMSTGLINLGKNMDTFAPLGPCMVLRDDIGDVHNLKIELRVNGDPRQVSNTNHLAVSIPEIVSHWSVMRLEPGDIISTGTVSGVAAYRKPDPTPYWLKPGDVLESEIENIGILRNPIVEDKLTPEQEQWLKRREKLFAED
jgi:2-keto-4-pentenoate hydratase/2-oxohepta-3-ene-1,7-dioic acid hydratase in catechol pathway